MLHWQQCYFVNGCISAQCTHSPHQYFWVQISMGRSWELEAIHGSEAQKIILNWVLGRAQAPAITFWAAEIVAKSFLSIRTYLLRNLVSTSSSCFLWEKKKNQKQQPHTTVLKDYFICQKLQYLLISHFQIKYTLPVISLPSTLSWSFYSSSKCCNLFPFSSSFLILFLDCIAYGSFLWILKYLAQPINSLNQILSHLFSHVTPI